MRLDGSFSSVSVVCTKADDTLVQENMQGRSERDAFGEQLAQIDLLNGRLSGFIKKSIAKKGQLSFVESLEEELECKLAEWGHCKAKLSRGELVYRPRGSVTKRQRTSPHQGQRKRAFAEHRTKAGTELDTDFQNADPDMKSDSDDGSGDEAEHTPLTMENVEEVENIESQLNDRKKDRRKLRAEVTKLETSISDQQQQKQRAREYLRWCCIKQGNDYAKEAVKRDFAGSIRK